jgi:hypothetical protein
MTHGYEVTGDSLDEWRWPADEANGPICGRKSMTLEHRSSDTAVLACPPPLNRASKRVGQDKSVISALQTFEFVAVDDVPLRS